MVPPRMVVSVGWLLLVAGCVGPQAPLEAPALEAAADGAPAPTVTTWEGFAKVGAAAEGPAHLQATEALVAGVWKTGFLLDVEEMPEVVELRVDWTSATPTEAMFMVHAADDPKNPRSWVEFENPPNHMTVPQWPTQGPLCMRIPPEEVAPGHWHTMIHSKYGADLRIKATITTVGGKVSIGHGLHGHVADAEEAQQGVELLAGYKHRTWSPCELSGDGVK